VPAVHRTAAVILVVLAVPTFVAAADVDRALIAAHEGKRVVAIDIEGTHVTKEHVVRREIRTRVGEPLSVDTVLADVGRLQNLQIFASIGVAAEEAAPGEVRLRFVLREIPSWLPTVGLLYTEENGFSVGPGITANNLTGRAIKLNATAYFGGTTQYTAKLEWPWIAGPNHLSLNLDAGHRVRQDTLNEFGETSDELTPWVGRYLGEHGRVAGSFAIFNMRSDVDGKTLSPTNQDHLRRLGLRLGWDTRDSWTSPRDGWQNELELWTTGGFLGGDGDFRTLTVDVRRWLPTAPRQKVLLSGLLSLQSGEVGRDVPGYLEYHLGGANTIRGYDVNVLGKTLYGKNQLLGTTEYSFNLMPIRHVGFWKLHFPVGLDFALFADAGIAWSESGDFALKRARAGGGAGLRILNPVTEMIRLDVGWSPEEGFQFHLAAWSKPTRARDRLR